MSQKSDPDSPVSPVSLGIQEGLEGPEQPARILIQPIVKAEAQRAGAALIIDSREDQHTVAPQIEKWFVANFGQALRLQNRLRTETLPVGDLLFKWNDRDLVLIERKTLNDLLSSMKSDGRYREQKKRLLAARQAQPGLRVYYLIEGQLGSRPVDRWFKEPDRKRAYGASVNTLVRDGIPVIRTESFTDTMRTLGKIWELINKEGDNLLQNTNTSTNPQEQGDYSQGKASGRYMSPVIIKTNKGENQDEAWCYLAQLQQIPGVSEDVAEAISGLYPDMPTLFKAYQTLARSCSNAEAARGKCQRLFAEIALPKRKRTSTGKVRTIGPAVSERIWRFLGSPR